MDEEMSKLEAYFERLKKQKAKMPSWISVERPHFRAISAAAGIAYRHVITPPYKQRIAFAAEEIGLEWKRVLKEDRTTYFEQNCALINSYLDQLKKRRLTLPEDPENKGNVFFAQVEVEASLNRDSLILKGIETDDAYKVRLREMISTAAPQLGIDVRILPQPLRHVAPPITYELILEKGTIERKKELEGKPNSRQQLYNTRYALARFLRYLGLEITAEVGSELITEFKSRVGCVINEITSIASRKKFQTEITWWQSFYQKLLKEPSIPNEFHQAFGHLVDDSGLTLAILARLISVTRATLSRWYKGTDTPGASSLDVVYRAESIFNLPTGTLISKISGLHMGGRIHVSDLPEFLRQNPATARKVREHLPDDFCKRAFEQQQEIVESIYRDILKSNTIFGKRQAELQRLSYRLKEWPKQLEKEFDDLALYKMADRPPIGMTRNGKWSPFTKVMRRHDLGYLFGALCLAPDAEDLRLQGLGMPSTQLTIALIACPKLIDWYVRFRCETRNSYTDHTVKLLNIFKSMLRAGTGWLRQRPDLASRLYPVSHNSTELISPQLIAIARSDWGAVCDDAHTYYSHLIKEITPLVSVSRTPFNRIEGIVRMDDPMKAFEVLITGMKSDMPNPHTQPTRYHVAVRNCALVLLLATTGMRRNTLVQLNYTGKEGGHLTEQESNFILTVPRALFKEPDSPFFGLKNARRDYYMKLRNVYGLADVFSEYLNVSRLFLLKTYHPDCKEHPLFVNSGRSKTARLSPARVTSVYYEVTERHLAGNKWRGTGIPLVGRHGPHSARHIRGTAAVKKTRSFQIAGDANHHSENMARRHYALLLPEDRNRSVNDALFGEKNDKPS